MIAPHATGGSSSRHILVLESVVARILACSTMQTPGARRASIDGISKKVIALALEPGDLQLFKGRYSLHRVAPLEGRTPRYVAIFSYVEEPDMVGSIERTRQLYGKTLPIHHERAGQRADALVD